MFKNLLHFMMFVMLFGLGLSTQVMAQERPALFSSFQEAEVAQLLGTFSAYEPKQKAKNPLKGEVKFSETVMLAELATPHGWAWVIYPRGSELIWDGNVPIGDARCGNRIRDFKYPAPPPKPVVVAPLPLPVTAPPVGPPPTAITFVEPPRLTFADPTPLNIPPVVRKKKGWWVAAGAVALGVIVYSLSSHKSSPSSGTAPGGSTGPGH